MRGVATTIGGHAVQRGDALAVRTTDRDITYGELVTHAAGAAERLLGDGGAGPTIGLVRDAIDAAIATLAANAAGRPIIILPAEAPTPAIVAVARSAGASALIAPAGTRRPEGVATLAHYDLMGHWAPVDRHDVDTVALASTSGSTGTPRLIGLLESRFGPASTEGSVLRDLRPGDRIATAHSTASAPFGAMIRTLIAGATCSVLDVRRLPPSALLGVLDAHGATRVRMVPSVLRRLTGGGGRTPVLEQIDVLGSVGEALDWSDVRRLRALLPPTGAIANAYGLTETGLLTERWIPADEPIGSGTVGLGAPLPGRTLWIDVDASGPSAAAGSGTVGEIVVEGVLGATGAPMEDLGDGVQRYRTGDLGSRAPDGSFLHHGRIDRGTKVSGNRVDLGAVESAIRSVPGIHDVAVVESGGPTGTRGSGAPVGRTHLVAHVWADATMTEQQVRDACSERLMSSAVPRTVRLHGGPLPLLPSGKADLRRLEAASGH
jgi:acyl-coenzyme A synthetase/AMP-(fatty) acid ligase